MTRHIQTTGEGSRPAASPPTAPLLSLTLPNDLSSVQQARVAIRSLRGKIPERMLPDVVLLGSELVTNSLRHSGAGPRTPIRLVATASDRTLRIEVTDQGAGFHGPSGRMRGDPGGWGLQLVGKLSQRWGSEAPAREGFKVWFEMSLDT